MLSFASFALLSVVSASATMALVPVDGFVWNDHTTYGDQLDQVQNMRIKFLPHHTDQGLAQYLQTEYGGVLIDLDDLFQVVPDPDNEGDVLYEPADRRRIRDDVVPYLHQKIFDTLIMGSHPAGTPHALSPIRHERARQFIMNANLRIGLTSGLNDETLFKVRTPEHVAVAFSAARRTRARGQTYLILGVLTNHVPTPRTFNCTDWATYDLTPPPVEAPPPSATQIAQAVAGAVPNAADMGIEIGTAVADSMRDVVDAITARPPGAPIPAERLNANFEFAEHQLPAGVIRDRYIRYRNRRPFLGNMLERFPADTDPAHPAPEYGERWYFEDLGRGDLRIPSRMILSITGHPYLIEELSEKELLRRPFKCANSRPETIRHWYHVTHRHARDHGYYIHPLFAFRKNHGGNWGFTAGPGADDDLPHRLQLSLDGMKTGIFRLVQDSFEKLPEIAAIVSQCNGDGYLALKQIVCRIHPDFHPTPSILIQSYPTQRDRSLTEYYYAFKDFIELRAYIRSIASNLDDPGELDIFINGCRYATYLQRCVRDERTSADPIIQAKYTDAQIVDTLTQFLLQPDSPAVLAATRSAAARTQAQQSRTTTFETGRASYRSGNNRSSSRNLPVNSLLQRLSLDASNDTTEDSYADFAGSVDILAVPPDPQSRTIGHLYAAAVHSIQARPVNAVQTPCICCNENHRFDECPILANTEYIRGHYIRFCQYIRREAERRSAAFQGTRARLPVNRVDSRTIGFLSTEPPEIPDSNANPDITLDVTDDGIPDPTPTSSDELDETFCGPDDADSPPDDIDPHHFI